MPTFSIWANDRGFPQRVVLGTERPRLSNTTFWDEQDRQAVVPGSIVEPTQSFDHNCTCMVDVFDAPDETAANTRFVRIRDRGVDVPRHGRPHDGELWRFRGAPCYLDIQGHRLGVSKVLTDRARHNPEIHRITVLVAQVCERYHRLPKEHYIAMAPPPELAAVRSTLAVAESEMAKLHVLAASAQAMIDDGYAAYGMAPPHRHYTVACEFDAEIVRPGTNGQTEHEPPSEADLKPIKAEKGRAAGK